MRRTQKNKKTLIGMERSEGGQHEGCKEQSQNKNGNKGWNHNNRLCCVASFDNLQSSHQPNSKLNTTARARKEGVKRNSVSEAMIK